MNVGVACVTLKQHRFEVGAALVAALAVGLWALSLKLRMDAVGVSPACIADWLASSRGGDPRCVALMETWGELTVIEGDNLMRVMGFLPYAVGLLAAVPIVAREMEARTAQTAWSLEGSRRRWLVRQIWPILAVLAVPLAFVAVASEMVQGDRQAFNLPMVFEIGLHGPLFVIRALGAFGVGLFAGAVVTRTLPGFVIGILLSAALLAGVGQVRDAWWSAQVPALMTWEESETGVTTGSAWETPSGGFIMEAEAKALVPDGVRDLDEGEEQPWHSLDWLESRGYVIMPLGLTAQTALAWEPYDGLLFVLAGTLAATAAFVVVDRRRPT